jgi:hypothetical protein
LRERAHIGFFIRISKKNQVISADKKQDGRTRSLNVPLIPEKIGENRI